MSSTINFDINGITQALKYIITSILYQFFIDIIEGENYKEDKAIIIKQKYDISYHDLLSYL